MPWPLSGHKVKDDDGLLPLSVPTINGLDHEYGHDEPAQRSRPRSRTRGHIRTTSAQSRVSTQPLSVIAFDAWFA